MKKSSKGPSGFGAGSGCGPYRYSETSGAKSMSSSRGMLTSARGKMSSSHGTNGQSKSNNMNQDVGNSVGHDCRTFKHGPLGEAGYKGGGTAHANQPKGGKD